MSNPSIPEADAGAQLPAVPVGVVLLPFLVAGATLVGSIWLSVGLGLKACPLCFYQRTFVMGVTAVLGVGLLVGQRHRSVLNLLVLPLVVAGLGVAAFHVRLELTGRLECPGGLLGIGTAPKQSLAMFAVLLGVVGWGTARSRHDRASHRLASVGAAVAIGLLLAVGAIVSAPPLPPTPAKAYAGAFDMCRPPFPEQQEKK